VIFIAFMLSPSSATEFSLAPQQRARGHKSVPQGEQAYALLRERVISLVYRPGDYLNIATLVHDTGFGRTPVNQALQRLASEGLIHIMPRKGIVVAPLSIDSALDLVEVRIVNERLCAQLAAQRMTPVLFAELRLRADEFEAASRANDVQRLMNADRIFHETIARIAANPHLRDILDVLHAQAQRFWAVSLTRPGHAHEVIAEHAAILDALARADGEAAADAAEQHIRSFRDALTGRQTL